MNLLTHARELPGSDRLAFTAIHHAPHFETEWLEPLSPAQRYWSSRLAAE